LQVRHEEIAAEDLDVVTKTSAVSKLVRERVDIGTFGDTSGHRSGELISSPFRERGFSRTLAAERQEWGFFWCEEGQLVGEVFAVAK